MKRFQFFGFVFILLQVALSGDAFAALPGLVVSTGYDDGTGGGGTPVPPNPWFGSPNTTFYGNANDTADAPTGDPDLSGVLFQNVGATPISISDVSISAFDLFARAGVIGPLVLDPGQNFIFADGDGSDTLPANQTVSFTADGLNIAVADAVTAAAPDGVLLGNIPFLNGVETVAWTQVYKGTSTAVPEPSTWAMMLAGFAGLVLAGYRTSRNKMAAIG
jgi:hypothetical protein